jgi:hypothetical protein
VLRQLTAYLQHGELALEDILAIVPHINSTIRTVTYVAKHIEEDPTHLGNIVLDQLSEDRGMAL